MKNRVVGVLFCMILVGLVLLSFGMLGAASGESPSSDDWFIPYQRLPEDIRVILEERASPEALESIRQGHHPREELIQYGLGREEFEGDVYPIYHSEGVVYVFRGSGNVSYPDGGMTGVVLSGDDRVAVGEIWSAQASEAMCGKREPPSVEPNRDSSDRIYAGPRTYGSNNKYFGVRATVNFPQFVETDFNVYTTHLVFTDGHWFESFVGQKRHAGIPTAGFWVSWVYPQWAYYNMEPSFGSHKEAQIITRYNDDDYALMYVYDVDQDNWYFRYQPRDGATTRRVDLVQEQIRSEPVLTETATFKPTYIHLGGSDYVGWNRFNGPAETREDYPMQLSWINWWTFDFRTWCVGE